MGIKDSRKAYKTPQTTVVKGQSRGVLCQSPNTGAVTIDGYSEENLDW